MNKPPWWEWEFDLGVDHLLQRMVDRVVNETDLRMMLEGAYSIRPAPLEGRFRIETRYQSQAWAIIVEPDMLATRVVVVTAFPINR